MKKKCINCEYYEIRHDNISYCTNKNIKNLLFETKNNGEYIKTVNTEDGKMIPLTETIKHFGYNCPEWEQRTP